MESSRGPLAGFLVLDLCQAGPGRLATGILADYGANVISVVRPGYAAMRQAGGGRPDIGGTVERNKRSIIIDLKTPSGREVCVQMASKADAVLESNRPGVAARLGVDYESLVTSNPSVVYCAMSGFGQYGPYASIPAHDLSYQGVAGLLPKRRGRPYAPPYPAADWAAAHYGALAVTLGLLERSSSGRGQYIDLAFVDASMVLPIGRFDDPMLLGMFPCYAIYETADARQLTLSIRETWHWKNFCDYIARPDWADHLRPGKRLRDEMFNVLRDLFRSRTLDSWVGELSQHGIEFGPVNSTNDHIASDRHLTARDMVWKSRDPITGADTLEAGLAIKFSRTPGTRWREATRIGQDTREILEQLGYPPAAITKLLDDGTVE